MGPPPTLRYDPTLLVCAAQYTRLVVIARTDSEAMAVVVIIVVGRALHSYHSIRC
jgi:hypothetical protein